MSARKKGLICLALILAASLIPLYVWMSRTGLPRPADNDGTHQHGESNARVQPHATAANHPVPTELPSSGIVTYHNVRFDFAIDYPDKLLIPGQEADNGDGLQFASSVDDADIRAYGSYNALEQSPAEMLQYLLQEDCAKEKVSYKVSKRGLVAYSCLSPTGRIVYEKVIIHADTLATVRFDYAAHEQARWAPVIKQMADSLRLGAGPTAGDAQ